MTLKNFALVVFSLFISTKLHAQDYDTDRLRMETIRKMIDESRRKAILNLTFDEWGAVYTWKNNLGSDLREFGFDLYSKFTQFGKRYGIIKLPNDTITKANYELVNAVFNGGVIVANNNKLGMIDSMGKLAIPTEYDEIFPFINGRGFVLKNKKYAAATYAGKIITPFVFDQVSIFSDDAAIVGIGGRVGYINSDGNYISQPQYNNGTFFFNGFAKVFSDRWETLLKNEKLTNPRKPNVTVGFTKSIPFLINKKGSKIFTGESMDNFSISGNSFATIGRNFYIDGSKYYFESVIDTTGKIIVQFDRKLQIADFTNDWIIVTNPISGYSGVIGLEGKTLLPTSFYRIEALQYQEKTLGRAYFDKDIYYYIDKNCNCIEFENIKCPEKN
jgi:hypothetical protein